VPPPGSGKFAEVYFTQGRGGCDWGYIPERGLPLRVGALDSWLRPGFRPSFLQVGEEGRFCFVSYLAQTHNPGPVILVTLTVGTSREP